MSKLQDLGKKLLVKRDGPLTRELLLEPGRFGLGLVPERLAPDQTTTMICGFCSTGCSLDIHLKDGKAVSLTPTVDYPVNLGMACPKGWEALAPLAGPGRATTPLIRKNGELKPATWEEAIHEMVEPFQGDSGRNTARKRSPGWEPAKCPPKSSRSWVRSASSAWA